MIGRGPNKPKPVRDTATGREYKSMYQAGKDLARGLSLDPADQLVWYKIRARFPNRFQTRNVDGEWVALDDPAVPGPTPVGQ